MWSNRLFLILIYLMVVVLFIMCGCEGDQGPAGPTGTSPISISAVVDVSWQTEVFVDIYGCPNFPNVEINEIQVPYSFFGEMQSPIWHHMDFSSLFHHLNFPLSAGDPAHLSVNYEKANGENGLAFADITIPGSFELTSLEPEISDITIDDSLFAGWTSSSGADFYRIYFIFGYNYRNLQGVFESVSDHIIDTLTFETSICFSPQQIFPNLSQISSVESIRSSYFILWAVNGPFQGEQGNVGGDGVGMFHGLVWADYAQGSLNNSLSDYSLIDKFRMLSIF